MVSDSLTSDQTEACSTLDADFGVLGSVQHLSVVLGACHMRLPASITARHTAAAQLAVKAAGCGGSCTRCITATATGR